jgi:hypothetical protein
LVWIVSAGAAIIAAVLFLFGLYLWRMMVLTPDDCPFPGACGAPQTHHLHATRAEVVWLVSAVFGFIALASVLWPDRLNHIARGTRGDDSNRAPSIPDHTPAKGGRW